MFTGKICFASHGAAVKRTAHRRSGHPRHSCPCFTLSYQSKLPKVVPVWKRSTKSIVQVQREGVFLFFLWDEASRIGIRMDFFQVQQRSPFWVPTSTFLLIMFLLIDLGKSREHREFPRKKTSCMEVNPGINLTLIWCFEYTRARQWQAQSLYNDKPVDIPVVNIPFSITSDWQQQYTELLQLRAPNKEIKHSWTILIFLVFYSGHCQACKEAYRFSLDQRGQESFFSGVSTWIGILRWFSTLDRIHGEDRFN